MCEKWIECMKLFGSNNVLAEKIKAPPLISYHM
jgi:hypothetical protein